MCCRLLLFILTCSAGVSLATGQLIFLEEPGDVTVYRGESFTLNCSAVVTSNSSAFVHYQWIKDGQNLSTESNTLEVANAQDSHAGIYVCIANAPGGLKNTSRNATVTVLNSKESNVVIIAASSAVAGIVVLLVATVTIICLYLCLKRGHTWSKGGGTGDDVEEGNGSSLLPRRTKSLRKLLITVPPEQGSSTSLDNNLQSEDDQGTEEDDKDFNLLNLDESLFEQTSTERKSKPIKQLLSIPLSSKPIKKVRSMPEKKRKSRDKKRFKPLKGYEGDILEGDDTAMWSKNNMEDQAAEHRDGRRASEVSEGEQSDVSYEFARSQNKSMKSVRFEVEVEDTEGGDSGHVTGSSTPYDGGRCSGEPEEYRQRTKRRSSAPECSSRSTGHPGKLLLEIEDYDDDYDDGDNRITPSSTSLEQSYLNTKEDNNVQRHDSDCDSEGVGVPSIYNSSRSIQTQSTTVEVYGDSEEELDASPAVPYSKVPVAKLISTAEQWKDLHREETSGGSKLDSAPVPPESFSGKVTETRKKFLSTRGQTNLEQPLKESTLERRSKHLSRLVTETTKQLFPEPPRQLQPQHSHTSQLGDRQRSMPLASTLTNGTQPIPWRDDGKTDKKPQATTKASRTVEHEPLRPRTEPNPDIHELIETCGSSEADLTDGEASRSSLRAESLTSSPLRSSSPILPIPIFAAPFSGSSWKPSSLRGQNVAVPFSNFEQTDEEDDLDLFEMGEGVRGWLDTEVGDYGQDLLGSSGSISSGGETRNTGAVSSFPNTSGGVASISPIGPSMFGKGIHPRFVSSILPAKEQTNEAFFYSPDEPRQHPSKMVNHLPTIPEEGLERDYSATDILQCCT